MVIRETQGGLGALRMSSGQPKHVGMDALPRGSDGHAGCARRTLLASSPAPEITRAAASPQPRSEAQRVAAPSSVRKHPFFCQEGETGTLNSRRKDRVPVVQLGKLISCTPRGAQGEHVLPAETRHGACAAGCCWWDWLGDGVLPTAEGEIPLGFGVNL